MVTKLFSGLIKILPSFISSLLLILLKKILISTIDTSKIINLKEKYNFLKLKPFPKLSKKNKKYFLRIKIQNKDISVLKYTNWNVQLDRSIKTFFYIQSLVNFNSILDLGCGAGYFLYLNKFFKKKVTGLDWFQSNGYYNDKSIFFLKEMNSLFNLKPIDYKITEYFKPKIKKKFDLITAFSANFDGEYINRFKYVPWSVEKYEIFFENLSTYLKPNGKFFIKFNEKWEYKSNFYIDEKYIKYLNTKNFWYEKGIVTNIKIDKNLNHFLF